MANKFFYFANGNRHVAASKADRHQMLCEGLNSTYRKKNADYGDSFGETFADLGIISAITRISDKYNRIKNLAKLPPDQQQVKSESITDTLLDMANYCIMTVMEIESISAANEYAKRNADEVKPC